IDSLVPPAAEALIVLDPDYLQACYSYYSIRKLPSWRITPPVADELKASSHLLEEQIRGFRQVLLVRSHDDTSVVVDALNRALKLQSYRRFNKASPIEVYLFSDADK